MRGMRGINRNCRHCGKPFTVDGTCGGKCYCSTECRDAERKKLTKIYRMNFQRKHGAKARVTPYEKTCTRCGQTFIGKYQQKYCPDCLETGGCYMHKLRDQRSTDFSLWEVST